MGEQMTEAEPVARQYAAGIINITNRCTLRCRHCFVYRDGNPNNPGKEMDTATILRKVSELKERHGLRAMLWMGGEPLLRPDVLIEGTQLFPKNIVTTNGTLDLIGLPRCTFVVSIDGPPELNDSIRGKGAFAKVMATLSRVPERFEPTVMCQCVVTKANEDALEELVELLRPTQAEGMTFSFYVPRRNDDSEFTWGSLERRDKAVHEVIRLKNKHSDFIWNTLRALELTLSENAKSVTDNCPSQKYLLPLYLEGDEFVSPFCCYGNDVDCDLCGSWAVFNIASKLGLAGRP
ncbi:MAG: radical SAM protein [Candidatus Abyssobacteria bacterium SURF_17]|uniref:Radical SAM protein n=1 Tax=Candidatus Abyssobacteria bacterium SURF_17 TaxID=2093361 RepID=A0A419EWQ7_9BACT|nr:MAG: radical SAM protein [Candidatus Abyssubacteria bacterium SURF_17]